MTENSQPAQPPRLGPLEAQVMDVLWNQGPSTVRGIIDHLPQDPAYTTIATVLVNLDRKQLVTARRERRSTQYAARVGRDEHAVDMMRHALATSQDRAASILQFVETVPASDLELLRDYLRRGDPGGTP